MATAISASLVHMVSLALYIYTIYATFFVLDIPHLRERFKAWDVGQMKYLTVWNLIVQGLFFLVCLLNDIFGTNAVSPKKAPFIRRFKDSFHASIGFPIAMFVGVTFWALMFVDRELVLPKALDPYFPPWLNHLMHTLIMITTVLEMLIAPRKYPKRSQGMTTLSVFMLLYVIWIHIVYYMSGVWAYPVLEILNWPLRIAFYLVLLSFSALLYFAGEALDRLVWGNSEQATEKSRKNRKQK